MKRQVEANLPTKWGEFKMIVFAENEKEAYPHFLLIHNFCDISIPVAVRIHSECLTGDLLGSLRCDCGEQLAKSMKIIKDKKGILIYLRQEGRGIGLINKLHAYNLQDNGLNTIDANIHLGFEPDERDYNLVIDMLNDLNVKSIDLITNNPEKISAIENSQIQLNSRIPVVTEKKNENKQYLKVKKDLLGHFLD